MAKHLLPYPVVSIHDFPVVTLEEMREVDRIMIEEVGISLDQMMENAGVRLAQFARDLSGPESTVAVLIGKGNNGGGGLVAARHLHNWGHHVNIILATPGHFFKEAAMHQLRIVNNMQIPMLYGWDENIRPELVTYLQKCDVILDALLGYSLVGRPQDIYADLISMANQTDIPIVSLDIPSGLNPTTGKCFKPCIHALATLTLAAPKTGLTKGQAAEATKHVFVADISVPNIVWKELGYDVKHLFRAGPILQLHI